MIGQLSGIIDDLSDDRLVIDVNGVGYVVEISSRTRAALPPKGEAVTMSVETYVREDQLRLFGFLTQEDKVWFKLLMGVQGVGAKVALAILGVLSASELSQAIAAQDKEMIARAPGVGAKVAQRIGQELKDKVPESAFIAPIAAGGAEGAAMGDALSALVNLGYARSKAHGVVAAVAKQAGAKADAGELIRLALQELGK